MTLYLPIRVNKHFHDGCGAFVNNIRIGYGQTDAVAIGTRSHICRIAADAVIRRRLPASTF